MQSEDGEDGGEDDPNPMSLLRREEEGDDDGEKDDEVPAPETEGQEWCPLVGSSLTYLFCLVNTTSSPLLLLCLPLTPPYSLPLSLCSAQSPCCHCGGCGGEAVQYL